MKNQRYVLYSQNNFSVPEFVKTYGPAIGLGTLGAAGAYFLYPHMADWLHLSPGTVVADAGAGSVQATPAVQAVQAVPAEEPVYDDNGNSVSRSEYEKYKRVGNSDFIVFE